MREKSFNTISIATLLVIITALGACVSEEMKAEEKPKSKPKGKVWDLALLAVEKDQATSTGSKRNLANRNLLLGRYKSYAHCSVYQSGCFARNVQDGDPKRKWALPKDVKQGWVDASLGLLTTFDKVVVREAGDSVLSYELKAYDGTQWQSLAKGKKLGTKVFRFEPLKASAFRVDIKTKGGGGIGEIEVYNTSDPNSAFPDGPSPELRKVFAGGKRVAILLGSPYAFADTGIELFDKRNPEVRPLPDSGKYLKNVISFLLKRLGGKDIKISLPDDRDLAKADDIVAVFKEFSKRAGISFSAAPDMPLLVFGPPLPAQSALFKELHGYLSQSRSTHSRGGTSASTRRPDAIVTPLPTKIGKTMPWVGARASTFDPGNNEAAWLSYFRPNAVRTWNGAVVFQKYVHKKYPSVKTIEDFERQKAAVRSGPEESDSILWKKFMESQTHANYTYEYSVLKRLGITVVNETGPKDWPNDWGNNFRNWVMTYMATYYLAKYYDVEVHQYGNEPDSHLNKYPDEVIALKLQLISDAIHCAIADVNRRFDKKLKAQYAAPVLASNPVGKVPRAMMRSLRTDYRGKKMDSDLVQYFNRHRYGDRARQNVLEVNRVNQMMLEESATGKVLPQIFTELNYSTGGNWRRPHMTVTSDSPEVFSSLASIWGQMMATQKVHGVFLFKLYAPSNQWSNTVCYEFVRESDSEKARYAKKRDKTDVGYSTKNAEVLRLFAEGFSNGHPLLKTDIDCSDMHFQTYTSYNPKNETYYLWTVQPNDSLNYEVEIDLSKLDVSPGARVVVKEVSDGSFGEVVFQGALPANRKLRLVQPKQSAWLVSIPRKKVHATKDYAPVADTTVRQGTFSFDNYGSESSLKVRRHSNSDNNHISFIRFKIDDTSGKDIHKALLRVHGRRRSDYGFDDSFVFKVYGLVEDDWRELVTDATNAPGICETVSAVRRGVTTIEAPPVGHMSFTNKPGFSEIDVTNFVKEHKDQELTFLLIRELKLPGENTDFAWAELGSREGKKDLAPRLQVVSER